ncbi:response regulator transcription factor [Bifidobacterium catulorum]|nr:response regulator transcription factor [Bifidobacterium catulorum]
MENDQGCRTIHVSIVDNDRCSLTMLDRLICGSYDNLADDRIRIVTDWCETSGRRAIARCNRIETTPDVLLLDMSMEDVSGVRVCEAVRSRHGNMAILGITSYSTMKYAKRLADAGAQGLVPKLDRMEIVRAVVAVADGGLFETYGHFTAVDESYRKLRKATPSREELFTEREFDVMDLCSYGLTSDEIAERLGISPSTVKTHVAKAMKKLGARNRAEAVGMWVTARE